MSEIKCAWCKRILVFDPLVPEATTCLECELKRMPSNLERVDKFNLLRELGYSATELESVEELKSTLSKETLAMARSKDGKLPEWV